MKFPRRIWGWEVEREGRLKWHRASPALESGISTAADSRPMRERLEIIPSRTGNPTHKYCIGLREYTHLRGDGVIKITFEKE